MDVRQATSALRTERMRLINEGRGIYEDAAAAKRGVTREEQTKVNRIDDRIAEIETQIRGYEERNDRETFGAAARFEFDSRHGGGGWGSNAEGDMIRGFLLGDPSCGERDPETGRRVLRVPIDRGRHEMDLLRQGADPIEARALAWDTGSVGSAVPREMARTIYQTMEASVALYRMGTTKLNTTTGATFDLPKIATHSIATQVAGQGTALAGTDPVFDKITFNAYKAGELCRVASEVIQDAAVDISGIVGKDMGRAVGRLVGQWWATGTGSGQPQGVMTALGGAGSITTGGSLIDPTPEKLIDLQYSVNDEYRSSPAAAWLMRDLTAATIRKLRDGAGGTIGAFLYTASPTAGLVGGAPDTLLGKPAYCDPNVASLASNAKVLAFGDFSAYYIRQVGDLLLERDDSVYFATDEIALRAKWRVDGKLTDSTALNVMVRNV